MAAGWEFSRKSACLAVPLLALAWTAHALPVCWAAAMLAYNWSWEKIPARWKLWIPPLTLAALVGLRCVIVARYPYVWSLEQTLNIAGVDQVWVFGQKYFPIAARSEERRV